MAPGPEFAPVHMNSEFDDEQQSDHDPPLARFRVTDREPGADAPVGSRVMGVAPPPPVPAACSSACAPTCAGRGPPAGVPAGRARFSMRRTREFEREPLPLLLRLHEEYGPVFSMRLMYAPVVFALGPEANHYMTVSGASNFRWRDGGMGDLIPLLGDGLLTTDGDYHRRARRIMLPAFHREQIAADRRRHVRGGRAGAGTVAPGPAPRPLRLDPPARAPDCDARPVRVQGRARTRDGTAVRAGARILGTRVRGPDAARARQPLSPDGSGTSVAGRGHLRGDRQAARVGERGSDLLSLLMDATDEDGSRLSKQELRDQVMTLLFAGHDTTTSTVTFLFYELARNPGDHDLGLAIDETLRMYPPAWIGPRRSIDPFELHGVRVPGGVLVNYCSWASHHLAEVFRRAVSVPPRALHRGGARRASEGRLRSVRRRLAHVHRHALRPARGPDDRRGHPGALFARARRARAPAVDPPDADALAEGRDARERLPARVPLNRFEGLDRGMQFAAQSCQTQGGVYGPGKNSFVQQAEEELTELERFERKQFRSEVSSNRFEVLFNRFEVSFNRVEVSFNRVEEWKRLEGEKHLEQQAAFRHQVEEHTLRIVAEPRLFLVRRERWQRTEAERRRLQGGRGRGTRDRSGRAGRRRRPRLTSRQEAEEGSGIHVPGTGGGIDGLAKQVGKAGKQFKKASKQVGQLTDEVRAAREKAEQVGKAIS